MMNDTPNVGTNAMSAAERVVQVESGGPDAFDEIEDRLDHPPLLWDPKEALKDPDKCYRERRVIGVVEERETRTSTLKGSSDYEHTVLRLRDGTRVGVPWWGTVLKNAVVRYDPRIGDTVGIEYMGTKPNSDPSLADIELFDVIVRRGLSGIPETHRVLAQEIDSIKLEQGMGDDLPMPPDNAR